ncbi:MAG: uroporphyrinogen decarboxylase family protein [Spirochaetaceae bacterium]|jgi:uroporphyrinogen-III decarboxylase|nr:uroporphyrinogen decarboxylase family protein [Spirochaetaceae bacterium]
MRDYGITLSAEQNDKIDKLCESIRSKIKKEGETPRARYEAVWKGKKPGRIPVTLNAIGMHSAALMGMAPPDLHKDPGTSLIAYLNHMDRFGYDMLSPSRFSAGEIEFGGVIGQAEGTIPMLTKGALEDGGIAIDNLKFPDVFKDGTLPWQLWFIEAVKEKLGDLIPVFGFTGMPGGTVSTLMSLEQLYLKMKKNRPLVHSIAAIYTKFVTDYSVAMVESGADAIRFVGNDDVLSYKVHKEFEFPYMCGVTRQLDLLGAQGYIIGAGDWTHVLEGFAQAGVKGFDIISGTPLQGAAEIAVKYGVTLIYGVDAHLILHGSKDEIRSAVKKAIDEAKTYDGLRFTLSSEALDYATPNEKIDWFIEACKEFGRY